MLTLNELSLTQCDTQITGLSHLLDTQQLSQDLQQALSSVTLNALHKHYIRYKPATSLLVYYQMQTQQGNYPLYAKAYSDHYSKLKNGDKKHIEAVVGKLGRIAIPRHNIEVYLFPNDARLRGIKRLLSSPQKKPLLKKLFPKQKDFHAATIDMLQYKPERRYVAKLTSSQGNKAVLKIYNKTAYQRSLQHVKQLAILKDSYFPCLLAENEKYRVLVFSWREGQLLAKRWQANDFNPYLLEKLARQLADFHQLKWQQARLPRKNNLDEMLRGLSYLSPHLTKQANSLSHALKNKLKKMTKIQARCHGDFYAEQIVCQQNELYWLDLDDVCLAHPSSDLGTFIAHLQWDVIRGNINKKKAQHYENIFIAAYQQRARNVLNRQEINDFIALHLFQLIHHPFRACEPNWTEQIEKLLMQIKTRLFDHKE